MEKKIEIFCDNIKFDGLLSDISTERKAVITHPHPLYGGNMENPVVELLQEELTQKGYSTLRFNFRQVNMAGSDEDSIKDLKAAIEFLNGQERNNNFLLAGYSYGSWINTSAVFQGLKVSNSIMISPPIAFIDYNMITNLPSPGLIVTGTNDDVAPPELVKKKAEEWNPALNVKIIKGCDHFYGGYAKELKKIISDYLSE